MTTKAWITLGITWSIITYFTLYFFLKVLKSPPGSHDDEP